MNNKNNEIYVRTKFYQKRHDIIRDPPQIRVMSIVFFFNRVAANANAEQLKDRNWVHSEAAEKDEDGEVHDSAT